MKKIAACLAAMMLLLAGCGSTSVTTQEKNYTEDVKKVLSGNYSFTADFAYEELTGSAKVTKNSAENLTAELLAPDSVNGMVMQLQGDKVSLTYHDTAIDISKLHLPTESIASLVLRVLSGEDEYTFEEANGALKATADCTFFHYTVVFDTATMTPTSISIPELKTSVTIRDFTPLPGSQNT